MDNPVFWNIFEQCINILDNLLLLIFPTILLGSKTNKTIHIVVFIIIFILLTATVNSYNILKSFQNVVAISLVFIYSIFVLKGDNFKKISISIITVFLLGIATVPLIFVISVLFNVTTDIMFEFSKVRFISILFSRIVILLAMIAMYYFAKIKGNLTPIQWLFMGVLFIVCDIINSLVLYYTEFKSIPLEEQYIFLGISSCVFFIAIIGFITFSRISNENQIKIENEILKKEKLYQQRNIKTIRVSNEEISHLKHDFKNYLLIIKKYILNNENDKAIDECEKLTGKFDCIETLIDCDPSIIALIINEKIQVSKRAGIDIKCNINQIISVYDNTDFIIVFTNLIDNAIEHCLTLDKEKRKINIEIYNKMGFVVLKIENALSKITDTEQINFETTKTNKTNHGIGHKSVQKILTDGGGDIKYSIKNHLFIAEALFMKK